MSARPDWADKKAKAILPDIANDWFCADYSNRREVIATALREALASQRATIAAQEEAGRLANISTARAIERAEKAERELVEARRVLQIIRNNITGSGCLVCQNGPLARDIAAALSPTTASATTGEVGNV